MRHTSPCVAERYGITSGRTRQGGIWFEGEGLRGGMITGQSQQKPLYTGLDWDNGPLTIGHHETNDRRNSMLVGPMAAVRVHPEFTAVHIDESSRLILR